MPLATWLGQVLGWRSAFVIVGLLGLLTAGLVSFLLPAIAAGNASPRRELGVFRRLQVWLTLLMVLALGWKICTLAVCLTNQPNPSRAGIPALRMLDLDDVGAPVGEDGPGRGHECELGHFQDADALHHLSHAVLSTMGACY